MIACCRSSEPKYFDVTCRQPGRRWLAEHPNAKRPRDFWSPYREALARVFEDRCAYAAMFVPPGMGTVDHFRSWERHPQEAYEWDNYRYACGWLNSCKGDADGILDPFEVEDGWFEILLPSLQLVATERIPQDKRPQAEETLRRLRLRDDERIIRQREAWLRLYEEGNLTLEGLRRMAPLIAQAVERKRAEAPSRSGSPGGV